MLNTLTLKQYHVRSLKRRRIPMVMLRPAAGIVLKSQGARQE